MAQISDPLDRHDWNSEEYVLRWAEGQDQKEQARRAVFQLLADTIPYDKDASIKILDLGAGYGALTQFLLGRFPNATAVCQDGSKEMADLGLKRMEPIKKRISYALSDLSLPGWSAGLPGPFEAVVSSIAIHNVRKPEIIERIYQETFVLVKPRGCFLNFDRMVPTLEDQMAWFMGAGFKNVTCLWKEERRALLAGFKD